SVTLPPTGPTPAAVTALPAVHVVNEDHLRQFAQKPGEKLVIVEESQRHLLPHAEQLVAQLSSLGVDVRLWRAGSEDFDTHPLRWGPQHADEGRLAQIEAGRLIGFRQNLDAFIDRI